MSDSRLSFIEQPNPGRKTKRWFVQVGELKLGQIEWFSAWRQYCFYPCRNTSFDASCLSEIIEFLNKEIIQHKYDLDLNKIVEKYE